MNPPAWYASKIQTHTEKEREIGKNTKQHFILINKKKTFFVSFYAARFTNLNSASRKKNVARKCKDFEERNYYCAVRVVVVFYDCVEKKKKLSRWPNPPCTLLWWWSNLLNCLFVKTKKSICALVIF